MTPSPTDSTRAGAAKTLFAITLLATAGQAQAFDTTAVGGSLFGLGALGGLLAAGVALWRRPQPTPFGIAFAVYLGALAVLVSTWSGTMDTVPLTLVFGAAAGVLPFAALFFGLRRLIQASPAPPPGP